MNVETKKLVVPVRPNSPNFEGPQMTVGVWIGDECVAAFAKLDDADLFAAAKRKEIQQQEADKRSAQGLCVLCGKSMEGLPFKFHAYCPE